MSKHFIHADFELYDLLASSPTEMSLHKSPFAMTIAIKKRETNIKERRMKTYFTRHR